MRLEIFSVRSSSISHMFKSHNQFSLMERIHFKAEISPQDLAERFLDDSTSPNIILFSWRVFIDVILGLVWYHSQSCFLHLSVACGPFFPRSSHCFFSVSSLYDVFSFFPLHLLNGPLLLSNPSFQLSLFTLLSHLPSPRVSPFLYIYIYLCSSDPWIKLHHGGRTILFNQLSIGQLQCAFILSASSTAMISPFIYLAGRAILYRPPVYCITVISFLLHSGISQVVVISYSSTVSKYY